jgi:hypothetical protein
MAAEGPSGPAALASWWSRRRAGRRPSPVPPTPFVVGATRSGTTLLRLMLDAHPQLAIPSETHFIPEVIEAVDERGTGPDRLIELLVAHRRWGDFDLEADDLRERLVALDEPFTAAEAVRAFYRLYADKEGKPRWGDKTPGYLRKMRTIQAALPEARFVHLIRDGRDVALSVLEQQFGPQTIEAAAELWRERIARARAQRPWLAHYIEVRFEDLVLDTEATLRTICEFIELPFDAAMLDYHERAARRLQEKARELKRRHGGTQSAEQRLRSHHKTLEPPNPSLVAGWRTKMDPSDRRTYEQLAGELLAELGYEIDEHARTVGAAPPRALPKPLRRPAQLAGRVARSLRHDAEPQPAPFVVGLSRSGGELLRAMLGAHPDLALAPSTEFVPSLVDTIRNEPVTAERIVRVISAARPIEELGLTEAELRGRLEDLDELRPTAVLRAFYQALADREGASRWGDGTLAYLRRMVRIRRVLPEARFVHVVRDGRDMVAARPGEIEPGKVLSAAQRWERRLAGAREDAAEAGHYLELRYEDLLADPEAPLRRVCELCELGFDEAMLAPPERDAVERELGPVGQWRERLGPQGTAAFEEVAGDALRRLGHRVGERAAASGGVR